MGTCNNFLQASNADWDKFHQYLHVHRSLISLAFHWREFLVPQLWYKEQIRVMMGSALATERASSQEIKALYITREDLVTPYYLWGVTWERGRSCKCQHAKDSCHKQANYLLLFLPQDPLLPHPPICLCSRKDEEYPGLLKQVTIHLKTENACLSRDTATQLDMRGKENKRQKSWRYIKRKGKIQRLKTLPWHLGKGKKHLFIAFYLPPASFPQFPSSYSGRGGELLFPAVTSPGGGAPVYSLIPCLKAAPAHY